jgi:hypothetical protein
MINEGSNPLAAEQPSAAIETPADTTPQPEMPVSLDDVQDETPVEQAEIETSEPEPLEQNDGLIDVEYDGETFKVPPQLKDALLRQADYTRKTQATAEMAKAYEAKIADVTRLSEVTNEEMGARSHLMRLNSDLQQYQQVDWKAYLAQDPIGANEAYIAYQEMTREKGNVEAYMGQMQSQRNELVQRETATRLQETLDYAKTNIQGWTPEVDAKVTEFATKDLGFSREQLSQSYNPSIYKALHLAWIGQQTLQRQQTAAKPVAAIPLKPTSTVSGKGATGGDFDYASADMATYAAHRKKEMARG